jgi:hypothetical protein
MSRAHGKDSEVEINSLDISPHTNSCSFSREADVHDTTAYGMDDKENTGGLKGGSVTIGGVYDNNATTGPGTAIEPLLGTTTTFAYRVEGTGTGKPEKTCSVVVKSYNESSPVADMVAWTSELTITGAVTVADQT